MAWITKTRSPRETVKMTKDPPTAELRQETEDSFEATLDKIIGDDETVEIAGDLLREHSAAILEAAGLTEDSLPGGLGLRTSTFDEDRVPTAQVRYVGDSSELDVEESDLASERPPPPDDEHDERTKAEVAGGLAVELDDGGLFESVFGDAEGPSTDAVVEEGPTTEAEEDVSIETLLERVRETAAPQSDSMEAIPNPAGTVEDMQLPGLQNTTEGEEEAVEVPGEEATELDRSDDWSFEEERPPPLRRRKSGVNWGVWMTRTAGVGVIGVAGWTFAAGLPLWLTITIACAGLVIALANSAKS